MYQCVVVRCSLADHPLSSLLTFPVKQREEEEERKQKKKAKEEEG